MGPDVYEIHPRSHTRGGGLIGECMGNSVDSEDGPPTRVQNLRLGQKVKMAEVDGPMGPDVYETPPPPVLIHWGGYIDRYISIYR